MQGWQTPTMSRNVTGDLHPDSPEGQVETYVMRADGYVVVVQAWRAEQMVKQNALDVQLGGEPGVHTISREEALPLLAKQEEESAEKVKNSNWQQFIEEEKKKKEADGNTDERFAELESRITAQDEKLDAILAALKK